MSFERASGVLLHPSSFPGPYGIGDIGPQAFEWVSFLAASETRLWQVLPLGPTGYGDSPYQCFSAFAGNPYLISPQALLADDLLHPNDLVDAPQFPDDKVDFGAIIPFKLGVLDRAYQRYKQAKKGRLQQAFADFRQAEAHWLPDFAIFMAIKEAFGGGPWIDWPAELRQRQPQALDKFIRENQVAIERHTFRQFVFFRQWQRLRHHAHAQGVQIIGDIPIFVAHDSADVWANPELFYLDHDGNPTVVAGVPPDYFSPTGQLWGNPLYRWDVHAQNGYQWWISRFRAVLSMVDIVRLDHFRGFAGYWEIPGDAKTAQEGEWVPGPGAAFLEAVEAELGELPIIAEDLGVITPDVVELRERFHLPGMKVLVFAFDDDASNPFLPHNYNPDCVVYTGTHDNDTVLGWYQRVAEKERDFARRYLARNGQDISWDMIRTAWSSVGVIAVTPLQDLLSLDNTARMNYPSTLGGNWIWRMTTGSLTEPLRARLAAMNRLYGRSAQPTVRATTQDGTS
ncbi:MAG: 4-alpha-glucanotransferase [Anaerolineales bacterium]|nr:4-alpha-glucanotransferase [Anaerolineales bacterium]